MSCSTVSRINDPSVQVQAKTMRFQKKNNLKIDANKAQKVDPILTLFVTTVSPSSPLSPSRKKDAIPDQIEKDKLSIAVTPKLEKEYVSDFSESIVTVNDCGKVLNGRVLFSRFHNSLSTAAP